MRKNLKKRLAMVLATAMVFSTPVAVNSTVADAATERAVPVFELSFENTLATGSAAYTESGIEFDNKGAEIVANPDDTDDKVIAFSAESDGSTKGDKYLTSKAGALKNIDFSGGFTISMDVKPTKLSCQGSDWTYIFAFGQNGDLDGKWNYLDGTIGLIARKGDPYEGYFPGSGWAEGNPLGGVKDGEPNPFDYFTTGEGAGKWSTLTYVYASDKISIYVNGVLTCQWDANGMDNIFGTANEGRFNLGTGISGFSESFVGYMDDVKVYNKALNADEVKIAATEIPLTVTDESIGVSEDKKTIDYSFKVQNAPADTEFEVSVTSGSAIVATGSAVKADNIYTYKYAPKSSGIYDFNITNVTVKDDKYYYLKGVAGKSFKAEVKDGLIISGSEEEKPGGNEPGGDNPPTTNPPTTNPPTSNPPTSNPPTSNPPTSNPPTSNPPATSQGTVKKVTVKAANQKAGTKTVYLKKGGKVTLTATVTGTGKFSKAVTWTSSKKAVATVSSKGVVKAKKAGTAKITVASKTDKTKKATITIKVSKKAKKNKKLTLKAKSKSLKKGKTYTVAIKSMTKGTTDAVTYKTSKKSVATVDKFGVVKAKKKGSATITVKCGKKSAKLKIKVK